MSKSIFTIILATFFATLAPAIQLYSQSDTAKGQVLQISIDDPRLVKYNRDTIPWADELVRSVLSDSQMTNFEYARDSANMMLLDAQTALEVAETILFKVYGKEQIISERPYHLVLSGYYWVMWGSMPPQYSRGGVFTIILDSRDGRVVDVIHGL